MAKKIRHIKYKLDILWSDEDDAYVVHVPELPGCVAHGETVEEAVEMAKEAIDGFIETLKKMGRPAPVPMSERPYSGKIPLRIDPMLHRDLAIKAVLEDMSLNAFIEKRLQKSR